MKAKRIAFSAIICALTVTFLYAAFIIPTMKLSLYVIASVFLATIVLEFGAKSSLVAYLATCMLAFILIPDKTFVLPYILFMGYYPILKYLCESKIKNRVIEYSIKLLCGNLAFLSVYHFAKSFFGAAVETIPFIALLLLANMFFILYDYVFTLLIHWYGKNIQPKLKFR